MTISTQNLNFSTKSIAEKSSLCTVRYRVIILPQGPSGPKFSSASFFLPPRARPPGAAGSRWEPLGTGETPARPGRAAGSRQEPPGSAGSCREPPGAAASWREPRGAARSRAESRGALGNRGEPPAAGRQGARGSELRVQSLAVALP